MSLNNKHEIIDVLIVGAGPASTPLCHYLNEHAKHINFLIVDIGTNITKRDHNSEFDCVGGIGGAGLFSDGKFSWCPAGTRVWSLENNRLRKSYTFLKNLLDPYMKENNDVIPDFPK